MIIKGNNTTLGVIIMKRNLLLMLFLVFALAVGGCSQIIGNSEDGLDIEKEITISDYYPFHVNAYYDYEGIGNEFAEQQTYFEFIEGNRAQIKIANPGTTMIKVLEYTENTLTEVYYEAEFYHIENMINSSSEKKDILLKEPLEVGNSWSDSEGHKRSITAVDKDVDTPYGQSKAIEVTTELGESTRTKRYYAKDVGLVASIYEDENGQVKTLLKSIKEMPLQSEILSYYPSKSGIATLSIKTKIEFRTNDKIEKILEYTLKNPPSDKLTPVLSEGTVINTIVLDRGKWILKVDFSEELLSEMNMGSSGEREMLKSLVNTLGTFYDTDQVYISIDGKPYESGHYGLKEGESFKVDLENIEEF